MPSILLRWNSSSYVILANTLPKPPVIFDTAPAVPPTTPLNTDRTPIFMPSVNSQECSVWQNISDFLGFPYKLHSISLGCWWHSGLQDNENSESPQASKGNVKNAGHEGMYKFAAMNNCLSMILSTLLDKIRVLPFLKNSFECILGF